MLVKVKQMQVSSSVKQLDCDKDQSPDTRDTDGGSLVPESIQKAIDVSIDNYKLRKRY